MEAIVDSGGSCNNYSESNMAAEASLQIKKKFIQGQQINFVLSLILSVKGSEILMSRFGEHEVLV